MSNSVGLMTNTVNLTKNLRLQRSYILKDNLEVPL